MEDTTARPPPPVAVVVVEPPPAAVVEQPIPVPIPIPVDPIPIPPQEQATAATAAPAPATAATAAAAAATEPVERTRRPQRTAALKQQKDQQQPIPAPPQQQQRQQRGARRAGTTTTSTSTSSSSSTVGTVSVDLSSSPTAAPAPEQDDSQGDSARETSTASSSPTMRRTLSRSLSLSLSSTPPLTSVDEQLSKYVILDDEDLTPEEALQRAHDEAAIRERIRRAFPHGVPRDEREEEAAAQAAAQAVVATEVAQATSNQGKKPVSRRVSSVDVGGEGSPAPQVDAAAEAVAATSTVTAKAASVDDGSEPMEASVAPLRLLDSSSASSVSAGASKGLQLPSDLREVYHLVFLHREMAYVAQEMQRGRRARDSEAKRLSKAVLRHFELKQDEDQRRERTQLEGRQRLAANTSKEVRKFWAKIVKVIELKRSMQHEIDKTLARDQHLDQIVEQTERFSSLLASKLAGPVPGSSSPTKKGKQPAADDDEGDSEEGDEDDDGDEGDSNEADSDSDDDDDDDDEDEDSDDSEDSDDISDDADEDEEEEEEEEEEEAEEGMETTTAKASSSAEAGGQGEINTLQHEGELPIEQLLEKYALKRPNGATDQEGSSDNDSSQAKGASENGDEPKVAKKKKASSTSLAALLGGNFANGEEEDDEDEDEYGESESDDEDEEEEEEEVDENDDEQEEDEDDENEGEEEDDNEDEEDDDRMEGEEENENDKEEKRRKKKKVRQGSGDDEEGIQTLLGEKTSGSSVTALDQAASLGAEIQPTGFTLATTNVTTKVPFLLRGTLREYQMVGLHWLVTMYERNLNGVLADEMGLGKTIQTISLLAHLAAEKQIWGPHLIVVPTSVMLNWEMEFKKWCPSFKILVYYGSQRERRHKRVGWTKPNQFHVCITSYTLVMQDHRMFRRKRWEYLILDEAQNIKNFRSNRWQTLLHFQSHRRLLLTGTPLQNNLMELWSLLHFLMPKLFESHKEFQEWFSKPVNSMVEGSEQINQALLNRLHTVLRPFLLRRLKKDVEKQLPSKYEHIVTCRMSKRQRFLYDEFMSRAGTKETLESGNVLSILNCLMQLRKVCAHPDLFETRPIVSPFTCASIEHSIPALAVVDGVASERPRTSFLLEPIASASKKRGPPLEKQKDIITVVEQISGAMVRPVPNVSPAAIAAAAVADPLVVGFRQKVSSIANMSVNKPVPAPAVTAAAAARSRVHLEIEQPPQYVQALTFVKRPVDRTAEEPRKLSRWWRQTEALAGLVSHPRQRAEELSPVLSQFVVVIPPVQSPPTVSHPHVRDRMTSTFGEAEAAVRAMQQGENDILHGVKSRMLTFFPDKRLLQYDCGKLQQLEVLLRQLHSGSHRVLIFSQMTRMLDILEIFLNIHGYRYLRLDGATGLEKRQYLMERFNTDKRIFVFILSTRSGGVGVNLTGADTVIFYDSDWNPAMDAQAQDRAHRIGQTRDVHVYRLITEHSIEENILRKAMQKRLLDDMVIGEGSFTTDFFKALDWRELFEDGGAAKSKDKAPLGDDDIRPVSTTRRTALTDAELEKALASAEDDADVVALKRAKREAQLVGAPEDDFVDKQEQQQQQASLAVQQRQQQLEALDAEISSQLRPIERYALRILELNLGPDENMSRVALSRRGRGGSSRNAKRGKKRAKSSRSGGRSRSGSGGARASSSSSRKRRRTR